MSKVNVVDRLNALINLKEKHFLQSKAREWKIKANAKEVNSPTWEDYRTQIGLVVKLQKDADMASVMPEYQFIPENENGRKNRLLVKEAWDYWWRKASTDKQVSRVAQSSTTYGTGIMYEGIKHIFKNTKVPYFNEEKQIKYREKLELKYSWIYNKKIPFENFFINGTDIDDSTECVVIDYIDKDSYILEKKENPMYKNIEELSNTSKSFAITTTSKEDIYIPWEEENVVMELSYYNSAKDEYIVVANGIEVLNTHIPYTHKELPFCLYYDNLWEDRIWGIWEFELTEQDERTKNEIRTEIVKWAKANVGFWLKDRDTEFEEDDIQNGIWEVYEVSDIEWIQHISPSIQLQALESIERKVDNDIIIKTWQDINSLQTTSESATKTAGKNISSKKRINKTIKDNAYDFYKRLAYLRMKNIQFLHTVNPREIPIKWGSIKADGMFVKDSSDSYGSTVIWENQIEWEYDVEPLIDSMTWNNKIKRKENALRYAQVVSGITWADGKPVIKWEPLAELITQEFTFDFDRMTQDSAINQSWEDIINELDMEDSWLSTNGNNPMSPDYIPPNQRSGASREVPTMSGQAKIWAEDIIAEDI